MAQCCSTNHTHRCHPTFRIPVLKFAAAPRCGARGCGFPVMVPDQGLRSNPCALARALPPSVSSSSPGKAKFFDKGRSEESTGPATDRRNQGNLKAAEVDNSPAQLRTLCAKCCMLHGENPDEHENKKESRTELLLSEANPPTAVRMEYMALQAPPWTAMRLNNAAPCKT